MPPGWGFVHVFVSSAVREEMLASHPEATEPLTWGGRVVGVRIDLGAAPASLVKSALRRAWMAKAPASVMVTLEGVFADFDPSQPSEPLPRRTVRVLATLPADAINY